jgi:hypothetical protein
MEKLCNPNTCLSLVIRVINNKPRARQTLPDYSTTGAKRVSIALQRCDFRMTDVLDLQDIHGENIRQDQPYGATRLAIQDIHGIEFQDQEDGFAATQRFDL